MTTAKLEPLVLSDGERQVLEEWVRGRKTAQALAGRSRIVLACAGGASVGAVAAELGISWATAAKWRSRFQRERLEGLTDEPRPGRPRTITDEQVRRVIAATLQQEPPGHGTRWSTRSMARQVDMSQTAISRIWRASGLRPHLAAHDELINDSARHRNAPPLGRPGPAYHAPTSRGSTTLAAERRDLLVARLRRDGKLVARDLAAELGVSEDSVRRDLRDLAAAGLCQRVYGGALPISPAVGTTHTARTEIAADSKRRVATRAAQFITPGMTAILDGGTTAAEVVAALPPDLEATIVTHGATTAAALASHPTVNALLLGGLVHKQSVCVWGATAAEAASGITADVALLIMPGIHPQQGLTTAESEDAAMKRILISRAAETYVMASIEKLATVCAYKVADFSEVAGIITDATADHPTVQELRNRRVTIIPAA